MSDLSSEERTLILCALGNICADAVAGDDDAFEALSDPFWVEAITSLDKGMMDYGAFVSRILRLKKEGFHAGTVRRMRHSVALSDDEGSRTRRLYHSRG